MRISDWSSDVCSSDLPRLDALLEVEFDQAGAFACQLLKQLDELDRAILRGARPPLGQRRLAEIGRHTSELQSLMRISYAVFCLQKKILHTHPDICSSLNYTSKISVSTSN